MLLKKLREEVLEANLELVRQGLVLYTFGSASGISRDEGLVVIKPSGVKYDQPCRPGCGTRPILLGKDCVRSSLCDDLRVRGQVAFAVNPEARSIGRKLHDKHFLRKYGRSAYYGQGR